MDNLIKLLAIVFLMLKDGTFYDDENRVTKEGAKAKANLLKSAKGICSEMTIRIADVTNNFNAIKSDTERKKVQIEAKGIDGKRVTNNIIKQMFTALFKQGETKTVAFDEVRNFIINGYHKGKAFAIKEGLEVLDFGFDYNALKGTNVDASMLDNIRAVYNPIVNKNVKFPGLTDHIKAMLNTNLKYVQQNVLGTNSQGAQKSDSYNYYFELSEDRKTVTIVFKDAKA